jgi:hypothetical protein
MHHRYNNIESKPGCITQGMNVYFFFVCSRKIAWNERRRRNKWLLYLRDLRDFWLEVDHDCAIFGERYRDRRARKRDKNKGGFRCEGALTSKQEASALRAERSVYINWWWLRMRGAVRWYLSVFISIISSLHNRANINILILTRRATRTGLEMT